MTPGDQLGHYEILEPLGAGGMGEVYRARDTKLDRDVAIKVLPEDFATDQDRLARFEREAKLLASLNHANIAAIYGLEDEGDQRFIVLEVVEGETLAELIAQSGRIEVEEALDMARQIAEALEAAHENGVIHRDLKPANVKVTPDGKVKVLDFGLAIAYEADGSPSEISPDLSHSPTMAAATRTGVILGTAAYMSPEQARGKPVDKRTDIWAVGCVLYEMLAGKSAFGGETVSDTMAAILKEEPNWDRFDEPVGPRVRDLLERCLRKDARTRIRDIGDARIALVEIAGDPAGQSPAVDSAYATADGRGLSAVAALGIAILAVAAGAAIAWTFGVKSAPVERPIQQQLTFEGSADHPALSPDGESLAYAVATCPPRQPCQASLEVQDLASRGAPADIGPSTIGGGADLVPEWFWSIGWSPDGRTIVYTPSYRGQRSLNGVYTIPATGGVPDPVARDVAVTSASFRSDGVIDWIAFPDGLGAVPVFKSKFLDDETVEEHPLPIFATDHRWSPDGRWLAFAGKRSWGAEASPVEVAVVDADFEVHATLRMNQFWSKAVWPQVRWGRGGEALYVMMEGDVWALRFDPESSRLDETPDRITQGADDASWVRGEFDVAANGESVVYSRSTQWAEMIALTFDDQRVATATALASGTTWRDDPALSPDGETVVYIKEDSSDLNIYTQPFRGGEESPLTTTAGTKAHPTWSHDGTRVAYVGDADDGPSLFTVEVVGGERVNVGPVGASNLVPYAWFPESLMLLLRDPSGSLLVVADDEEPRRLMAVPDDVGLTWGFAVSPDASRVAMMSHRTSLEGVPIRLNVAPLEFESTAWNTVSVTDWSAFITSTTTSPTSASDWRWATIHSWMPDGRLLVSFSHRLGSSVSAGLWALPTAGGEPEQLLEYAEYCGAPTYVTVTADLSRVVCINRRFETDIWKIDNFDPGQGR